MPIPLLDGSPVFGSVCAVSTPSYPRVTALTATFGTDGLEPLDGGARGTSTTVQGTLFAASALGLAATENAIRVFNDGQTHVLTDTLGTDWPNVRLTQFQPVGRIRQTGNGVFYRRFIASLFHQS